MVEPNQYEENTICIPNIGSKERRKRFIAGSVSLVVGVPIWVLLIFIAWPWWTRLVLFLPFVAGFSGIFQAREKTWVNLAMRGLRNMDEGKEHIEDAEILTQVRRQARKVNIMSFTYGIVLIAIAVLLPILFT